ncbi:secretin N-terminal domain-containing protein [Methylotenera versatilis]|nr:secretin N-terminal domain-containing protein [Methylotenera versatilis]
MIISLIAHAETEFKIITLQHRFASDLLPTITPMVGADGTATGMQNQLILRASSERMRNIEAMIETLDTERVNRRITVSNSNNIDSQLDRTEASGTIRRGNVIISNDRRAAPNTGRIDIERSTSNTSRNNNQFINVVDGERAYISNGQIVPFTQEWISLSKRYIQIDRLTDWREVTTGFAVRPRTIGNQVELEITPRIARLNNQGFIDFESLTTTIRVGLGDWVNIGGTMQNNDEISRKILGLQSTSNSQNSNINIKVE